MNYLNLLKYEYSKVLDEKRNIFEAHETLMVKLCEILNLDYVEATEEDVIHSVQTLKEMVSR